GWGVPGELSEAGAGDVRAGVRRSPARRANALTSRRRASTRRLAKNSPNAASCPPPRGTERLPAAILDTNPLNPEGDMSQNAPLSVPLLGNTLVMETRTASLVTMEAATDKEAVAAFVEATLAGGGCDVESVRARA